MIQLVPEAASPACLPVDSMPGNGWFRGRLCTANGPPSSVTASPYRFKHAKSSLLRLEAGEVPVVPVQSTTSSIECAYIKFVGIDGHLWRQDCKKHDGVWSPRAAKQLAGQAGRHIEVRHGLCIRQHECDGLRRLIQRLHNNRKQCFASIQQCLNALRLITQRNRMHDLRKPECQRQAIWRNCHHVMVAMAK